MAAPSAQYKLCKTGIQAIQANIPNKMNGAIRAKRIPHPVEKSVLVNMAYRVNATTIAEIAK